MNNKIWKFITDLFFVLNLPLSPSPRSPSGIVFRSFPLFPTVAAPPNWTKNLSTWARRPRCRRRTGLRSSTWIARRPRCRRRAGLLSARSGAPPPPPPPCRPPLRSEAPTDVEDLPPGAPLPLRRFEVPADSCVRSSSRAKDQHQGPGAVVCLRRFESPGASTSTSPACFPAASYTSRKRVRPPPPVLPHSRGEGDEHRPPSRRRLHRVLFQEDSAFSSTTPATGASSSAVIRRVPRLLSTSFRIRPPPLHSPVCSTSYSVCTLFSPWV